MQPIASFCSLHIAEYFINNDPGEGAGTVLEAKDGAFDSLYEEVSLGGIDISGLAVGDHRIGIRFKDKTGNWSVVQYRGFRVQSGDVELEPDVIGGGGQAAGNHLVAAEYFINNDPGEGAGTVLEAKDGAFDSLYEEVSLGGIDISGLAVGDHRIGIRFKDKTGNWSVVQYRGFRVQSGDVELEPDVIGGGGQAAGNHLVAAEYFINNDPGEGAGTALETKDGAFDSLYEEVSLGGIDISGLPVGDHRIGIRFKDKAGNWSVVQYRGFRVQSGDVELEPDVIGGGGQAAGNHLVAAEYFINNDPGEGAGTALEAKDGAFDSLYEEIANELTITKLKGGVHRIGIRFMDNKGNWSLTNLHYFKIYDFGEPEDTEPPVISLLGDLVITINKGEEFSDPGATALDDVDGDLTDEISIESNLNINVLGEYTLIYSVTDLSGNVSDKLSRRVIVVGNIDTDSDGLTDSDETNIHKTDPNLADTDSDGLNDGDEVNTHKTNPNLADTDSDGLNDGDEVNKYGTNPLIVDTDEDGLTDGDEVNNHGTNPTLADTDSDGLNDGEEINKYKTNPNDPDTDNDGLNDGVEVFVLNLDPLKIDTDADGVNDGDEDFDSDGLTNLEEVVTYNTNPVLADTDLDGLSDGIEVVILDLDPLKIDSDNDGINDGDEDFDSDGLTNLEEVVTHNTNPALADTDLDGLTDGDEINTHSTNPLLADSDNDSFNDGVEVAAGTDPTSNTSNPTADTDSDGLTDVEETVEHKTNPNVADTDEDGLNDGDEVNKHKTDPLVADTDEDGLSDGDEVNIYETNPLLVDSDNDGLSDWDEINKYKTNPNVADTDGDGLKDGDEVNNYGTNPLLADTDGDGLPDGHEVKRSKTNPLVSDTDEDKTSDGDEVAAGTDPNDPDSFPINIAPPVITLQPETLFVRFGAKAELRVEAINEPLSYQWFRYDAPIEGATSPVLRIEKVFEKDVGTYRVVVSNPAGVKRSKDCFLEIVRDKPEFIEIPTRFDLVYESGETIILDPKIQTEGPTIYQWDKDGNELTGETNPILIIENVKDDDAGNYSVDATNLAGTTVSETMRVSVVDESKIGKHVENNFIEITGFIDSSPAIGQDGSVYYSTVGEFGYLYRHEPNGVRKWGLSFDSALRGSPAIDDDGIIYVLEDTGVLHAVSDQGSKGKIDWSYKLTGEEVDAAGEDREHANSPAITEDGTIIFGWFDSNVYAVKEGELVWKFPTEGRVVSSPSIAPDGTIYIGTEAGLMYAIKPDGNAAWSKPFATGAKIMARPAIDTEGNIYFGSFSGQFYALEPNRAPKWQFDTEQDIWTSAVVRADGTVYFGADDGNFYALDTESGKVKWTYEIEENYQLSSTAALGLDGSIYFTLFDNTFYAINRIGEELWTVKLEGDGEDVATYSSPSLLDDGKIYVGTKDGKDGVINVIQGGSPIDIESPWPSFGGDMQNTGRVMVKKTDAESFKAELRVTEVSSDSLTIQITGDAFETYKLQYSNDLRVWKIVPDQQSIQTNFRGRADFKRTIEAGSAPTFYRLKNE